MYYLYKKLPKKLRQLKELCDLHEKSEFVEGGYQPKEASVILLNYLLVSI